MKVVRDHKTLKRVLSRYRDRNESLGFVPTMGALHAGHKALIRSSQKENKRTLVSIFVNPLQFGPREDLKSYPRRKQEDLKILKSLKVDVVFLPNASSILRMKQIARVKADRNLTARLCGPFRPGHFNGVLTIVAHFFRMIEPRSAYFGQKDYQQYRVIEDLVQRRFQGRIRVKLVPTVREPGGLALSSRNLYLNAQERQEARRLYRTLQMGRRMIRRGSSTPATVTKAMRFQLSRSPLLSVQYLDIVDSQTLGKVVDFKVKGTQKVLIALAVSTSKARLIDNILVRLTHV